MPGGQGTLMNATVTTTWPYCSLLLPLLLLLLLLLLFFFFLWLHMWHMEAPGLGVELELQLPQQHWIHNPLIKAKNQTHILTETL